MSWVRVTSLLQDIDKGLQSFPDQRDFFDLWNYAAVKTTPSGMSAALEPLLWKAQAAATFVDDNHPSMSILIDTLTKVRDVYVGNLHSNQYTHIALLSTLQVVEGRIDQCLGQDGIHRVNRPGFCRGSIL